MNLYPVVILFSIFQHVLTYSCIISSNNKTCVLCNQSYFSYNYYLNPSLEFPIESCQLRLTQKSNLNIYIVNDCSSINLPNYYCNILTAFYESGRNVINFEIGSQINFIFLGKDHYILRKDIPIENFQFFRNSGLNITLSAGLCSEIGNLNNCLQINEKITIYLKTDQFHIFNSATMKIKNIIFNGIDIHLQTGNDLSANYNKQNILCNFLKIISPNDYCNSFLNKIQRNDELYWKYPFGLFNNEFYYKVPELIIEDCDFVDINSVKIANGFLSLIKITSNENKIIINNTNFSRLLFFKGILTNYPSFNEPTANSLNNSQILIINSNFDNYNYINKSQNFEEISSIIFFKNFNKNFELIKSSISNIAFTYLNPKFAYYPINIGHQAFYFEETSIDFIKNDDQIFNINECIFSNLMLINLFILINYNNNIILTNLIENCLIKNSIIQYTILLKSYSLIVKNTNFNSFYFNHILRWEYQNTYNPLTLIENCKFLNLTGFFIDGTIFQYNSILSYNNLTYLTPYHPTNYTIVDCLFEDYFLSTLIEGRKSFEGNFSMRNILLINYQRMNLKWSVIGIAPMDILEVDNMTTVNCYLWELVNARWSPRLTIIKNIKFINTALQALFHIRATFTPDMYFEMIFENIIMEKSLYIGGNTITSFIVDHGQIGFPSRNEYTPLLKIINCSLVLEYFVNVGVPFLELIKFIYPLHIVIFKSFINFNGSIVISQSSYCYYSSISPYFKILSSYIMNNLLSKIDTNSLGLVISGYDVEIKNSIFKQNNNDKEFAYSFLPKNKNIIFENNSFINWVFNLDGILNKLSIKSSIFNLTKIINKLNSQHLQIKNDPTSLNFTIKNTIFIGQPVQGSILLAQNSQINFFQSIFFNPLKNSPILDISSFILAESKSKLEFVNSQFFNCFSQITVKGGCIYSEINAELRVINSSFKNAKSYYGSFIFSIDGKNYISNSLFSEGYAQKGGAIFVVGGELILEKTNFEKNKAEKSGGHLFIDNLIVKITQCNFNNGLAILAGGAIASNNLLTFEIYLSNFFMNSCLGLSILSVKSDNLQKIFKIYNCTFSNNQAQDDSLFTIENSNCETENVNFLNNSIKNFGSLLKFSGNINNNIELSLINVFFEDGKSQNIITCIYSNIIIFNLLIQKNFISYDFLMTQNSILKISYFLSLNNSISYGFQLKLKNSNITAHFLYLFSFDNNGIQCIDCKTASLNFLYFYKLDGQSLYFDNSLNIFIDSIFFLENKGDLSGISIYFSKIDHCVLYHGVFFHNKMLNNFENFANIYLLNSYLSLTDVLISETESNSIYSDKESKISIENSLILSIYEYKFIYFLNCVECDQITLSYVSISGFSASALIITSNQINVQLNFRFTNFFNNTNNNNGGALKIIGYTQGLIYQCNFMNNKAGLEGGALFYSCKGESSRCSIFFLNSMIMYNTANKVGGGIKIQENTIQFTNSSVIKNKATSGYGHNIASAPTKFLIFFNEYNENQLKIQEFLNCFREYYPSIFESKNQILKNETVCQKIKVIENDIHNPKISISLISGYSSIISFILLDNYSNIIYLESQSILLSFSKTNISAKLDSSIGYISKNMIIFNKFSIISIVSNIIILKFIYKVQEYSFLISFQECLEGDILLDRKCIPCSEGTYSLNNNLTACETCPLNSYCKGRNLIYPNFGYWKDENSSQILQCSVSESCISSYENNTYVACSEGNFGKLCRECDKEYGLTYDGVCHNCFNSFIYYIKIVLSCGYVLFFIYFQLKLLEKTGEASILDKIIKIGINHTQYIMILGQINFFWQTDIKNFFDYQSQISPMPPDSFSLDCIFLKDNDNYSKFKNRLYIIIATPIFYIFVFGSLLFLFYQNKNIKINKKFVVKQEQNSEVQSRISSITEHNKNNSSLESQNISINETLHEKLIFNSLTDQIKSSIFIICYDFYVILVSNIISVFECFRIDYKGNVHKYFLLQYTEMQCYETKHYEFIFSFFVPGIIIWIFGFPLWILIEIKKKKKKLRNFIDPIDFIIRDYKSEYRYWEIFMFFKKFVIILCAKLLVIKNKLLAGNTFILITAFFFFIFEKIQPYNNDNVNSLESISYFTIIISAHLIIAGANENLQKYQKLFYLLMIGCMVTFYFVWILNFIRIYKNSKRGGCLNKLIKYVSEKLSIWCSLFRFKKNKKVTATKKSITYNQKIIKQSKPEIIEIKEGKKKREVVQQIDLNT